MTLQLCPLPVSFPHTCLGRPGSCLDLDPISLIKSAQPTSIDTHCNIDPSLVAASGGVSPSSSASSKQTPRGHTNTPSPLQSAAASPEMIASRTTDTYQSRENKRARLDQQQLQTPASPTHSRDDEDEEHHQDAEESFEIDYSQPSATGDPGHSAMLGVATTAAMPTGPYPTSDMPYWSGSFLGNMASNRGMSDGSETPKGLCADSMTTEASAYGSHGGASMFPADMNWARSDLAAHSSSNSMQYVPRRVSGDPWSGNTLASRAPFANTNAQQQVFGAFGGMDNTSTHAILPSNGYVGTSLGGNSSSNNQRGGWQKVKNTGSQSFIRSQRVRDGPAAREGSHSRSSASSSAARKSPPRAVSSRDRAKSGDRTTHNDVERKYRTNLKDKIAELRAAVPSLQAPMEAESDSSVPHQAAPKVSKGTVLSKATEYIQHLEQANRAIMTEHQQLAQRLHVLESLLHSGNARQQQHQQQQQQQQQFVPGHNPPTFDPRAFS